MKEREDDLIDKFTGQLYDQYEVLDVVGSGTFGKVYLVLDHAHRFDRMPPNNYSPWSTSSRIKSIRTGSWTSYSKLTIKI